MKISKTENMNVGEAIKLMRKAKGISQRELGDLCGKSDSTIWAYENNVVSPSVEVFMKIITILNGEIEIHY